MLHPVWVGWDGVIKVANNDAKKTVLIVDWPEGCETPAPCPGLILRHSKTRIDGFPAESPGSAGKHVFCVAQVLDEAALPLQPAVGESLRPDTRQRRLLAENPKRCPVGTRESGGQLAPVQCPVGGACGDDSTSGSVGVACQGRFSLPRLGCKVLAWLQARAVASRSWVGKVQHLSRPRLACALFRGGIAPPEMRFGCVMRVA
jgi:hypothetical protein